jgi:hypothetical protein
VLTDGLDEVAHVTCRLVLICQVPK